MGWAFSCGRGTPVIGNLWDWGLGSRDQDFGIRVSGLRAGQHKPLENRSRLGGFGHKDFYSKGAFQSHGELRGFPFPQILRCYVTEFTPDKALK